MRKKGWMFLSLGCLAISILSLFLNILSYTNAAGVTKSYNFLNLVSDPAGFTYHVSTEYEGTLFENMYAETENMIIICVAAIGLAALICAVLGVLYMSRQRPSSGAFFLALLGLLGTALPAVSILVLLIAAQNHFAGTLKAGLYIVITPLAMILSVITVSMKHNRTKKQMEARKRVEDYLRLAGDL